MIELVCSLPFSCTNKNVKHETDDLKELHGSLEHPIPVEETRINRYVAWEYKHIGRVLPPYHRCFQQLFEDRIHEPRISIDRVVVRDIKGNHHVFYFDVSAPMNADLVIRKKAFEDFQAGKPIDPKMKAEFEKAMEIQRMNSRIVKL
jgi:hypothetical protein